MLIRTFEESSGELCQTRIFVFKMWGCVQATVFFCKFCFSKFDIYFRTTLKFSALQFTAFSKYRYSFSAADNKVTLYLHLTSFKCKGIAKMAIVSYERNDRRYISIRSDVLDKGKALEKDHAIWLCTLKWPMEKP